MEETFGALVRQFASETEVPRPFGKNITKYGLGSGLALAGSETARAEHERDFYSELPINIRVSGST